MPDEKKINWDEVISPGPDPKIWNWMWERAVARDPSLKPEMRLGGAPAETEKPSE